MAETAHTLMQRGKKRAIGDQTTFSRFDLDLERRLYPVSRDKSVPNVTEIEQT